MIGVKTEVKTDWKNYVLGNSRGPFRIDKGSVWFKGFNQGDMMFISYHVKWKGVDWGGFTGIHCFQACNYLSYRDVGPANGGAESGEMDVVTGPWKADTADWTHSSHKVTENDSLCFYSHVADGRIKVADDGYIELTNIMIGKGDRVQPYIDSDKLKATGGVIVSILLIMLATTLRKEVAA